MDKINSPRDLKRLDIKSLDILADEIREYIINNVSETGGHLASNLGVVDLTIAMHYAFNCPKDKFIWDVGHQAYTHKILTGRREQFNTLRKYKGLSGFPKTKESEYDAFDTGHSSTSISVALGMARARDLREENYNIVSVIGDGSMTGGLVYEAMNNVGQSHTKMLIILNDNQMSISQNVGSMSKYLNELRTAQRYQNAKDDVKKTLKNIPVVGQPVYNLLGKTKEGIKYALTTNANVMFEQLGITYIGPVDGHDIKKLVHLFNKIKKIEQPILLHVVTTKGKGYEFAEKFPSKFHGVGAFNVENGKLKNPARVETYSEVFVKKLVKLAKKDKMLCGITAAMPSGTGIELFGRIYPDRMFDVGIAEEHAVTFAAGMARVGCVPVFAVYSTFLQRAYDQIMHDVCIQNLPVIFAIDRAGIVGDDGETHQGIYDFSFLSHIPNLNVLAPMNKFELERMLEFAVEQKRPYAIRYPRGKASDILQGVDINIEYGKSNVIYSGKKIALISVGTMMDNVVEVYRLLLKDNYTPELINACFVSPIDEKMLDRLNNEFEYIFTFEDNISTGGYGAMVGAYLAEVGEKVKFKSFSFPKEFVEHGSKQCLFEKYGLDIDSLYNTVKEFIENEN